MAYLYAAPTPDTRHHHVSSFSALSGALDPAVVQPEYRLASNATSWSDGVPISTYLRGQPSQNDTLSAALGPAFQPHHHRTTPQSSTPHAATYPSRPHPLGYQEPPKSIHLQYPYPQRNVVEHPGYIPAPLSNQTISQKTTIPSGYRRISQIYGDKDGAQPSSWSRIGCEHVPIKFKREGGGKPFRVDELIKTNAMPELEGSFDHVFKHIGDRYIKVVLTWPGYRKYPVERRICTENGTLTRAKLLVTLAKHIEELMYYVNRNEIAVEKGYEKYELIWRPGGQPSIWRDCMIASLAHRSGSNWLVELYVRT